MGQGVRHEDLWISAVVLLLFFVTVALFVSGGILYNRDGMRGLTYEGAVCYVWSSSSIPSECISRYSSYPCYIVKWSISYDKNNTSFGASIKDPDTYRSASDANKKAAEHKTNVKYSCYYDTKDPSVAQWDMPSRDGLVLLIGGGMATFLLVSIISSVYIWNRNYQKPA